MCLTRFFMSLLVLYRECQYYLRAEAWLCFLWRHSQVSLPSERWPSSVSSYRVFLFSWMVQNRGSTGWHRCSVCHALSISWLPYTAGLSYRVCWQQISEGMLLALHTRYSKHSGTHAVHFVHFPPIYSY